MHFEFGYGESGMLRWELLYDFYLIFLEIMEECNIECSFMRNTSGKCSQAVY